MKLKHTIFRLWLNLKQRTSRLFCLIIMCLAALLGLNSPAVAGRIYVDGSLQACGDGISWGTAFRYLQDALAIANGQNDDQIWVRAGTYYVDQDCANPDGSGDRTETYQLVRRTWLLGGFNGTELDADERDPDLYVTILSGVVADEESFEACGPQNKCGDGGSCFQVGGPTCDDVRCCRLVCDADPFCCCVEWDDQCVANALILCGEAYHVVTAGSEIDDPENTVIDGFTIRDGWANSSTVLDGDHGGGMLIMGEPSVVRCTFKQNTASSRGGGMSMTGNIQPWIINSIFEDNPGEPANPGDDQVFPINGGGLACAELGDPILTNCLVVGNVAQHDGGGIFTGAGECPPGDCGGITLVNCTVFGNTANTVNTGFTGGGLYAGGVISIFDVDNCIFWDNEPDQIDGTDLDGSAIDYSDVKGGSPVAGTGNLALIPNFVNAPGDLRLTITSLCIDTGNDDETVIPCDFFDLDIDGFNCVSDPIERTPDLDLINRVLDGDDDGEAIVDMGAYEFIHPNVCPCPDICPADFDGSCAVDVKDLLFLLGAWGPCPDPPVECPADFDGSGAVDVKDLLFLLGAWGPCPCGAGPPPPSLREAVEDAGLDWPDDWDEFEDVMTDPESSQEDKDNYYCWMDHYLNHCTGMACTTPNCPGDAPFGHHE